MYCLDIYLDPYKVAKESVEYFLQKKLVNMEFISM